MGDANKFLRDEFKGERMYFDQREGSEFYLCSFQKSNSPLPLLIIRLIIFLGCLGMLGASIGLSITMDEIDARYYLVFMTHWGIISYTMCTFFGCWVSFVALSRGSIDCSSGLPWYVKAYWFCFNVGVATAFFITVFYYIFLKPIVHTFAVIDPVLDVFIHGISSVLLMTLLLAARHPSYIMHFYQPMSYSLIYVAFLFIYYLAGGTDQNGNPWIYPNIDFRNPGPTIGLLVGATVMMLVIHCVIVLIANGRDKLHRRYIRGTRNADLYSEQ